MLTTISKCLAVLTAVASLFFLGFAVVTTASGHNWRGDIAELPQFTFTKTVSETGTSWGLESRTNPDFSPKSGTLPDMVVQARKQLQKEQDARLAQLDQQVRANTLRLSEAKRLIEADQQAIQLRLQQLETELSDIGQQIVALTNEGAKLADQISQVQADTETRREEVIRLQGKLKEVRADKFRAEEQQKRLADLLVRVTGNINRIERRNQQLKKRVTPYEEPATAAAAKIPAVAESE